MEAIGRLSARIARELNYAAIVGCADVTAAQPAESVGRYSALIKVAHVDPDLIRQVVQTLLRKAGESVREGGEVDVGTEVVVVPREPALSSSRPGRYCSITISDSGPSVDKGVLARVFDPFFTEGEFGTGDLDLVAAYGIVAQSEGRIDVTSDPGRGNAFVLLLPERQSRS